MWIAVALKMFMELLCATKTKTFITMERAKKILKCALLAVVISLRHIPHHEQAVATVNIREGVTLLFSL
jgi:hypothetical protein